jgi:hypothetical protein
MSVVLNFQFATVDIQFEEWNLKTICQASIPNTRCGIDAHGAPFFRSEIEKTLVLLVIDVLFGTRHLVDTV